MKQVLLGFDETGTAGLLRLKGQEISYRYINLRGYLERRIFLLIGEHDLVLSSPLSVSSCYLPFLVIGGSDFSVYSSTLVPME